MHIFVLALLLPYVLVLFCIYRNLRKIKPFKPSGNSQVFITVVVACRNEEKRIKRLLQALQSQEYPEDLYEVIIVNDNSIDKTVSIALSFSGIKNLRIIDSDGKGKKNALLTGIRAAEGEIILTTDADCMPGNEWVSTMVAFFSDRMPDMIIGAVTLNAKSGFFGRFQELEFLSLQGITAGTAVAGRPTICNGANLAFTKDEYLRNIDNLRFDIPTGDDVFLLHSMKKRAKNILWIESSNTIVGTEASPDVKSFLRQRKRWASKGTAYRDTDSIVLGIVTFVTITTMIVLFILSLISIKYVSAFIMCLIIKSIPDFLILHNTTKRYGRTTLLKWFLPSQIVYPVYVLIVFLLVMIKPGKKGWNSV